MAEAARINSEATSRNPAVLAAVGQDLPTVSPMVPLMLDKDDVASLLSVGPATIENLHRTGQLRGRMVGKHLRWRPYDVKQFVEQLEEA